MKDIWEQRTVNGHAADPRDVPFEVREPGSLTDSSPTVRTSSAGHAGSLSHQISIVIITLISYHISSTPSLLPYWELGPRFFPKPVTTLTKRLLYLSLLHALPVGFFAFS